MESNQTNVSSAQKSAVSSPGEIEAFLQAKAVVNTCKQLQDEIKKLGLKIKRHEDNIKSITREKNRIGGAIQDLQVKIIICTKDFHDLQNCGVVGIVATHGKVDDGNLSREKPQNILPKCSGTSCPPADYVSLEEQIRKKGLEREVLKEELQREVARLCDVKSKFLGKKEEYLQFLDEASPQCAGSGSSTTAKIDP